MKKSLEILKGHLHSFHESWSQLSSQSDLINSPDFLTQIAKQINAIHYDILHHENEKGIKDNADIIDYMIQTPWGAPFVFDKPLLEAAESYLNHSSDDLKLLIGQFLQYKEEMNKQIFDYIEEIEKKLNDE